MPLNLSNTLVIGISPSALFDMRVRYYFRTNYIRRHSRCSGVGYARWSILQLE